MSCLCPPSPLISLCWVLLLQATSSGLVEDYSFSQTTLEQIFCRFAEQGAEEEAEAAVQERQQHERGTSLWRWNRARRGEQRDIALARYPIRDAVGPMRHDSGAVLNLAFDELEADALTSTSYLPTAALSAQLQTSNQGIAGSQPSSFAPDTHSHDNDDNDDDDGDSVGYLSIEA